MQVVFHLTLVIGPVKTKCLWQFYPGAIASGASIHDGPITEHFDDSVMNRMASFQARRISPLEDLRLIAVAVSHFNP